MKSRQWRERTAKGTRQVLERANRNLELEHSRRKGGAIRCQGEEEIAEEAFFAVQADEAWIGKKLIKKEREREERASREVRTTLDRPESSVVTGR